MTALATILILIIWRLQGTPIEALHQVVPSIHDTTNFDVKASKLHSSSRTDSAAQIAAYCQRYARITVNGRNRIGEVIESFDERNFADVEEQRRKISEAVDHLLDRGRSNKLVKYFRCVDKLSGAGEVHR